MYKCEIIADSIDPRGNRLTSFLVTYPRIVLAEMTRHRMFSRNVASSRAIPFSKMVKDVEENPFIPLAWQKAHKGMQGTEYFTEDEVYENGLDLKWRGAIYEAVESATRLDRKGVTKQLVNRLLEPFMWTTELITTGEEGLMNFFELRCPQYRDNEEDPVIYYRSKKDFISYYADGDKDHYPGDDLGWLQINNSQAEIHIQKIAEMMWDSYNESEPKKLESGEWHIPFGDNIDIKDLLPFMNKDYDVVNPQLHTISKKWKVKIATARAARLSYTTLGTDSKIDYEADIKLHDRLLKDNHMSPFEHCARVMTEDEYSEFIKGKYDENLDRDRDDIFLGSFKGGFSEDVWGWCNNFRGFVQYRYLIVNY